MRDNAIPPGDVGAPVHIWVDTARKLLELTRSRLHNLMTPARPSESAPSDSEGGADSVDWALPDTLPPPDLLALDRALDGDEPKAT